MSDAIVPPPPGVDTPVEDAPAPPPRRATSAPAPDALVPMTTLEQRREARAKARERRATASTGVAPWQPPVTAAGPSPVAGIAPSAAPMATAPGSPGELPAPASRAPQPYGYAPTGFEPQPQGYAPQPYGYAVQPQGYAAPPYGYAPTEAYGYAAQMYGYAPQPYAAVPSVYGYAPVPYGPVPYAQQIPKRPFTRAQRRAALLGSLVGQTILSLALHVLIGGLVVGGFIAMMQTATPNVTNDPFGSFTEFMSYWSHPDRFGIFALVLLVTFVIIAFVGWAVSMVWYRQQGLPRPHSAIALAWLTTSAITSILGAGIWPIVVLFGGFFALLAGAMSTTGGMWMTLFVALAIGIVLSGGIGMLFGWVYLLAFRPRPTVADLEAEAARAAANAERQAVAADLAELTRVE